jgi:hypothetical protein
MKTPDGAPLDLRLGVASGACCTGLIGSSGINLVVTGAPRVVAQLLADATDDLAVADSTNAALMEDGAMLLARYNRKAMVTHVTELAADVTYFEYVPLGGGRVLAPTDALAGAELAGAARSELAAGLDALVQRPFKGFAAPLLEAHFRDWHNRISLPGDQIGGMVGIFVLVSLKFLARPIFDVVAPYAAALVLWFLAVPFALVLLPAPTVRVLRTLWCFLNKLFFAVAAPLVIRAWRERSLCDGDGMLEALQCAVAHTAASGSASQSRSRARRRAQPPAASGASSRGGGRCAPPRFLHAAARALR